MIKTDRTNEQQAIKIHLVSYDPEWPVQYSQLANQIRHILGKKALLLEHVGSTSVPGLAAKPVIDVVLVVANSADESSYLSLLDEEGFVLRFREPDWFEHRLLNSRDIQANIHVFSAGCEEVGRMLAFRDWLRNNEHERRLYEQTKNNLALQAWKNVQDYADAKSEIVETILSRAIQSDHVANHD